MADLKRRNPAYADRQRKACEIYRSSKSKEQKRDYQLAKYGITSKEYEQKLKAQNGVCAICSRPPHKRRLNVDHDHKTKQVRGLLCWRCNKGIGWLWDDPQIVLIAATYLKFWKDKGILEER